MKDPNFTINGKICQNKLNLKMEVHEKNYFNTQRLPATIPILNENLPSIFKCQCFNKDNKNFNEECKNTELGHLFEHIMLEYLCIGKIQNGENEAVFEGVTNWNWEKETRGTFNIEIKTDVNDIKIVKKAFKKSVKLLKKILIN